MRILSVTYLIMVTALLISCSKEKEQKTVADSAGQATHKAVAEEVIQATSYTYIKVNEGDKVYWIAVTRREVKVGMILYFVQGMEMKNFESKDLNRTFDSVYFVDKISDKPMTVPKMSGAEDPHAGTKSQAKLSISITPAKGSILIGELIADKPSYAGKSAIVTGQVTKFNANIMGRNWVHIQDGSEADGKYDLTITTTEKTRVGDVVTFSGIIALDKDFGAGYKYEVIMEDAKILN